MGKNSARFAKPDDEVDALVPGGTGPAPEPETENEPEPPDET